MGWKRTASQAGFTLLELLTVVAILGVVAGAVVLGVGALGTSSQETACASDGRTLRTAQEVHRLEHGAYADEATLVESGLIDGESELNDVELLDDTYAVVPTGDCGTDRFGPPTLLASWLGISGAGSFTFDADGAIRVGGSGERQAIAEMDPMGTGRIELLGTRMGAGNGWGVVVHGVTDDRGRMTGYVFQMDPGYAGGRFVLRHRGPGGETRPLAVTEPPDGFDWRASHDVVVEVDGQRLVATVDGVSAMDVADLAAAADRVGSRFERTEAGAVGLRLWHSTDLAVAAVQVQRP